MSRFTSSGQIRYTPPLSPLPRGSRAGGSAFQASGQIHTLLHVAELEEATIDESVNASIDESIAVLAAGRGEVRCLHSPVSYRMNLELRNCIE